MGSTPLGYCWFIYKIGARTGRLTGQFETYAQRQRGKKKNEYADLEYTPVLLSIFAGCDVELLKTESLTHDAIPPLIVERQYRWTHLNMRPLIKTTGDTTREDTAGGSKTSGPSYRVPTLQHATRCPSRPVHPKSEGGDRHIH